MTGFEKVMSVLTGIYVFITGYYAWTSERTLSAIKQQNQTNAGQFTTQIAEAKKSADAAMLGAQAIMNAERARIVCSFSTSGNMGILTIRNCGRTPALLVDVKFQRKFRPPHEELPETPDYGNIRG